MSSQPTTQPPPGPIDQIGNRVADALPGLMMAGFGVGLEDYRFRQKLYRDQIQKDYAKANALLEYPAEQKAEGDDEMGDLIVVGEIHNHTPESAKNAIDLLKGKVLSQKNDGGKAAEPTATDTSAIDALREEIKKLGGKATAPATPSKIKEGLLWAAIGTSLLSGIGGPLAMYLTRGEATKTIIQQVDPNDFGFDVLPGVK